MKTRSLNNRAFSLLEVLLASIIFVISVGGIFVTIDAVRRPVADKETSLSMALFGKQVLESLRSQVNTNLFYGSCLAVNGQDGSCEDFSLYLGPHEVLVETGPLPLSNCGQSNNPPCLLSWPSTALSLANSSILNYTVSCGDGTTLATADTRSPPNCTNPYSAREVQLNINWTPSI